MPSRDSSAKPNRFANAIARRPRLIALLKHFRREQDKGLGDTVARLAGGKAGKRFAEMFAKLGGTTCGCNDAQKWLNLTYPF